MPKANTLLNTAWVAWPVILGMSSSGSRVSPASFRTDTAPRADVYRSRV